MAETAAVKVLNEGGDIMVVGSGEMDLRIAPEFAEVLQTAAASPQPVVVDIRSAYYIDSAILSVLLNAGRTLFNRESNMRIRVSADSHPLHVLKIVGFCDFMDIMVEEVSHEAAGLDGLQE